MNISQVLTKLKALIYSKSETDSLLGGKANSSHTHTKSQITDFPTIPSKTSQLTNDSGFLTSHQSLVNYVTQSNLSTALSGKVDRIDHGYKYITGNGTYSWCKLATITIKSGYINNPISFEVDGRGRDRSVLQVLFANVSDNDPSLASFVTDLDMNFYIKKVATSTWELYGNYSEPWGKFTLYRVTSGIDTNSAVIDTTLSNLSSAPSGTTRVSAPSNLYLGSYRVYVG